MPNDLVIATGNRGKLREIQAILDDLGWQAVAQTDLGVTDIEETGLSFIENAILKARHASRQTGRPALADDSGLSVDALGGAPGIYSARYSGAGATDAANVDKLLGALAGVADEARSARFHCVMALVRHADDPVPLVCHGQWEGVITHSPQGSQGFGYDPVFFVPTEGCTSAQLDPAIKNRLSHRGQALRQLATLLAAGWQNRHPPAP
jgi:XTP/dITP diphosphohydrolase